MNRFPQTLWDLLLPRKKRPGEPAHGTRGNGRRPSGDGKRAGRPARPDGEAAPRRLSMQDRYDRLVREMKRTHRLRVRKWRSRSTGCAWEVHYADGRCTRLIEAPYPRGPMSCAIFLHEVGHHAIGLRRYRPRCLEEYQAWRWALQTMRQRGFRVTPAVQRRMAESLRYAVAKARRRGLRQVPAELERFLRTPAETRGPMCGSMNCPERSGP